LKADGRFNNAGIAGEGSREGYEKSDDVEKFSQQLLKSEFKEWDDILRTNVTAHYVRLNFSTSYLYSQSLHLIPIGSILSAFSDEGLMIANEKHQLTVSSQQHPSYPSSRKEETTRKITLPK
jgi:NAD(P)-dependent dehydrogenase (short-subunit alcohol dehydrogenase family)